MKRLLACIAALLTAAPVFASPVSLMRSEEQPVWTGCHVFEEAATPLRVWPKDQAFVIEYSEEACLGWLIPASIMNWADAVEHITEGACVTPRNTVFDLQDGVLTLEFFTEGTRSGVATLKPGGTISACGGTAE